MPSRFQYFGNPNDISDQSTFHYMKCVETFVTKETGMLKFYDCKNIKCCNEQILLFKKLLKCLHILGIISILIKTVPSLVLVTVEVYEPICDHTKYCTCASFITIQQ